MIHRARYKPPPHIYPPDEWNFIEKEFMGEFLSQGETMFSLGNGYLGMRGCFEEGGPIGQNGTFINGFYESWPIVYAEEAYGFATTGQTIVNVTDTKIILCRSLQIHRCRLGEIVSESRSSVAYSSVWHELYLHVHKLYLCLQ